MNYARSIVFDISDICSLLPSLILNNSDYLKLVVDSIMYVRENEDGLEVVNNDTLECNRLHHVLRVIEFSLRYIQMDDRRMMSNLSNELVDDFINEIDIRVLTYFKNVSLLSKLEYTHTIIQKDTVLVCYLLE